MSAGQEVGEIFGSGQGAANALLRSPTVLIASIGFWGMNIYFFRRIGIDHVRVLLLDLVKEREEKAAARAAAGGGGGGSPGAGGGGTGSSSSALSRARRKRALIGKMSGNPLDDSGDDHDDGGECTAAADHDSSDKQSDCGDVLLHDDELDTGRRRGAAPAAAAAAKSSIDGGIEMTNLDPEGRLTQTAAGQHAAAFAARGGGTAVGGEVFADEEIISMSGTTLTSAGASTGTEGGGQSSASTSPIDGRSGIGVDAIGSSGGGGSPSKSQVAPPSDGSTIAAELSAPSHEVTSIRCFVLCGLLLILLFSTNYVWLNLLGGGTIGAVFAFYAMVTAGIVAPLPSTRWVRVAVMTVLRRAAELVNPRCSCLGGELRPIPFIDVFFADAMCSLSKVFFDWGMMLHLASHYPDPVPPSVHAIIIPSIAASLPYIIRARQCLIMHTVGKRKNDPKRYQHLLNALKYSSSLFPLCVSAYQKTVDTEKAAQVDKVFIALIVINSLYCLTWDIVMDWGMMTSPTAVFADSSCVPGGGSSGVVVEARANDWTHHCLRPRLRFGLGMSMGILLADCVLRFAWLLRFVEHVIFPNNDAYILWTQLLEAFRRAIWNLLRVEWENIKQSKAKKRIGGGRSFHDDEEAPFIAPKSISLKTMNRGHQN